MSSGERFDAITRLFGANMSRRQAMKVAVGGALGTAGLVALTQRSADAACVAAGPGTNCSAPNFCCPTTPFGEGTCAPLGALCCGATACPSPAVQQCCTGISPFTLAQVAPPFCINGTPAQTTCCGSTFCQVGLTVCAPGPGGSTCCLPVTAPAGTTCCGPALTCPPGTTCQEYPIGTFSCIPVVPSDRNIKENVVPVAW